MTGGLRPAAGDAGGMRVRACAVLLLGAAIVGPAWGRGGDCVFRTGTSLALGFGVIDPSIPQSIQQQASAPGVEDTQAGDCAPGRQMRIQVDGGQHDAGGQLRMKHNAGHEAYLRYAVQVTPTALRAPGNQRYIGMQLQGRLEPGDIATARGGTYSDTLRISVLP